MLRSFAYAASASELLRGVPAPEGWEEQARAGFLEAYLETVDPSLLPAGPPGDREAAGDLRAREGRLRTALRAQQPPRLGADPRRGDRPPAAERTTMTDSARVSTAELDRLVARDHHDPHSILGAHAVRRRRDDPRAAPGGRVRRRAAGRRRARARPSRRRCSRASCAARRCRCDYELEVRYPGRRHVHDAGPLPLRADAVRPRRAPLPRGPPRAAVVEDGRARARDRRRARHVVRRLGAGRALGLGRRRLQLLGRARCT